MKESVVIAPARWKSIAKVEELLSDTEADRLCELRATWNFSSLLTYAGLELEEEGGEPKRITQSFHPSVPYISARRTDFIGFGERLRVNQARATWPTRVKTPDLFKPDAETTN